MEYASRNNDLQSAAATVKHGEEPTAPQIWPSNQIQASEEVSVPGLTFFGQELHFKIDGAEWWINFSTWEIVREGELIPTTQTEFLIFSLLALNSHSILSTSQITQAIRGEWYSDHHYIHVHISRLRKKITLAGDASNCIRAVRGIGYRLILDHSRP